MEAGEGGFCTGCASSCLLSHPNAPNKPPAITQDVAPGDEVCISYLGTNPTKTSAGLLKDHGFVLPGNPNDRIDFGSSSATGSAAAGSPVAAAVLDAAALTAAAKALAPARMGDDPHDGGRLAAALRSLAPYCARGGGGGGGGGAAVAAQREAADALLRRCGELRAAFATTAETDAALLDADSSGAAALSPRVRAAVASRLERKRLLAAGEALLKAYVAGLE